MKGVAGSWALPGGDDALERARGAGPRMATTGVDDDAALDALARGSGSVEDPGDSLGEKRLEPR